MSVEILSDQHNEALALCDQGIELLESKGDKDAIHKLFKQAYALFPTNPKINSWLGYSFGIHQDKVALGLKHCKMAIDAGGHDALFFRNMGKLYLLQKNKRAAIGAFARGLQIEQTNAPILKEWKRLGFRRKPFLPFLSRDHILNKLLGKLTWKLKGK